MLKYAKNFPIGILTGTGGFGSLSRGMKEF